MVPTRMRRYRWSWPVCGAVLLAVSAVVWMLIGRLFALWVG